MLHIDGSRGEGGGQILRTALALALVTGKPFRISAIRAKRSRPGLMRQHLTAVNAAAEIGGAKVEGAAIGSIDLSFVPGAVRRGDFAFSVGTAGSTTLVLQTILPALMLGEGRSTVVVEGGTHNPHSPPFDFLARSYLPLVGRMGPTIQATLERPGFYPAGGGRIRLVVDPVPTLSRLDLLDRGEIRARRIVATVAALPRNIGEREVRTAAARLGWPPETCHVESVRDSAGPGNAITIEVACEHVTEVFTGFGQRGVPAERVADEAAKDAARYLASDVPAGTCLADQLMLPMALAGGGRFRTLEPTLHARTHAEILELFLGTSTEMKRAGDHAWEIAIGAP